MAIIVVAHPHSLETQSSDALSRPLALRTCIHCTNCNEVRLHPSGEESCFSVHRRIENNRERFGIYSRATVPRIGGRLNFSDVSLNLHLDETGSYQFTCRTNECPDDESIAPSSIDCDRDAIQQRVFIFRQSIRMMELSARIRQEKRNCAEVTVADIESMDKVVKTPFDRAVKQTLDDYADVASLISCTSSMLTVEEWWARGYDPVPLLRCIEAKESLAQVISWGVPEEAAISATRTSTGTYLVDECEQPRLAHIACTRKLSDALVSISDAKSRRWKPSLRQRFRRAVHFTPGRTLVGNRRQSNRPDLRSGRSNLTHRFWLDFNFTSQCVELHRYTY